MNNDIYWERQSGGLCRKHVINAYFGYEKINIDNFYSLCDEFDSYIKSKGYPYSQIEKFDCIYSSQETVISYIIGKFDNKYCLHIPLGEYNKYMDSRKSNLYTLIGDDDFVFVYNHDHIYGYKLVDGVWYLIDSLRGVYRSSLPNDYKLGYIIPRHSPLKDLEYNQFQMNKILCGDIFEYLDTHDTLGELEILLATTADMIGRLGDFKLLKHYYSFLRKFESNPTGYDPDEVKNIVTYFCNYHIS